MKKKLFVLFFVGVMTALPFGSVQAGPCPPPDEGQPCDIQPYDPVTPIYCKIKGNCQ